MDRSTLGHLLRPLTARGLIGVDADPGDRRRKLLSLSDEGRDRFATAQPLWAQAQGRFEREFGPARSDALRETMMHVTNVMPRR